MLAIVAEVRDQTRPALPDLAARARAWRRALDIDEAAALVRAGRGDELRRRLLERLLAGEDVD